LLDAAGADLALGGAALRELDRVDLRGLDPRLPDARLVLASDVDNPLLGERGAAAIYGPQKGADPDDVDLLEAGLTRWVDRLADALGPQARDAADQPGAGAAGGVGYAAIVALGAERRSGIDVILALTEFAGSLPGAQLVITGEGSLDEQSLHGKAPVGVADAARTAGVPVVAVAGRCLLQPADLQKAGISAAYALLDLEPDPQKCMDGAGPLLEQLSATIAREWLTPEGRRPATVGGGAR
jgi:glycerate kinase